MDERGRLLERLQQPVGHLVVHRVHALEHEHPPARPRTASAWRRSTTGSSTSSTRITCAPLGRDPGQVGMRAVLHAQAHRVGVGRRPRPAARPRRRARRCACRCPAGRGTGRRARAPASSAADSTIRACGWSSVPARATALTRALRCARPPPRPARSAWTCVGRARRRRDAASARGRPRRAARRPRARASLQRRPLVLEAVALAGARGAAVGGSSSSRKVRSGTSPPVAKRLTPLDLVDPEAAGAALVGQRGVEEAIGDDHPPVLERGPDHLRPRARREPRRTAAPRPARAERRPRGP